MKSLRYSVWGYDPQEVNQIMTRLEQEVQRLRSEHNAQGQTIEAVRMQLRQSKAEEELIREAIVDAKQLSKRLVKEAQIKASELVDDAERNIKAHFEEFEQSLVELHVSREELVRQKEQLDQELQAVLERYRQNLLKTEEVFEEWDANTSNKEDLEMPFQDLSTEEALEALERRLGRSLKIDHSDEPVGEALNPRSAYQSPEQAVAEAPKPQKQVILLPKDLPKDALLKSVTVQKEKPKSYAQTATGVSRAVGGDWSDEIPVYTPW